jgi:hypothetical protein
MAKGGSRSNRKLEALRRAQKIDEILLMGNMQSQAAADSAAEERPAGESHIVDLLESRKMSGKNVFQRQEPSRRARKRPKKARRPARSRKARKAKKSKKARRR